MPRSINRAGGVRRNIWRWVVCMYLTELGNRKTCSSSTLEDTGNRCRSYSSHALPYGVEWHAFTETSPTKMMQKIAAKRMPEVQSTKNTRDHRKLSTLERGRREGPVGDNQWDGLELGSGDASRIPRYMDSSLLRRARDHVECRYA